MRPHTTEIDSEKPDLRAGLYLVATPIGNLRDITLRAIETLRGADLILCEDTRVTKKLLAAYQIETKTTAYHDHSEEIMRGRVVDMLREGKRIALVSDAGMPLISDPGYKLVTLCRAEGLPVTSVPGANAPLAALQLSGLPSDKFCFLGFLPSKAKAREDLLQSWSRVPATLIAFDTAPRLVDTLTALSQVMAGRSVAVVREITKMFEETRCLPIDELLAHYTENGPPKGEIVLVIAPPNEEAVTEEDAASILHEALKTMRTKEAAAYVAQITGLPKGDLYKLALELGKDE